MEKNIHLEIAKLVGEPINYQLPVPVELAAIADVTTLEPGDKLWRFTDVETTTDQVLVVNAGGAITAVERSPLGDTQITLSGLHSKLEYVEVNDILASPDLQILARRKEAITRAMDKRELQSIIAGIFASTQTPSSVNVTTVSFASGDDIYDLIMKAKHAIEDYGDGFVLLCGSTVKEKIDTYDKDNAGTLNYNVTLSAKLRELGIDVMKIFGQVDYNGSDAVLLDAKKFVLLAKNSRIAEGKPVKFVRRKISAEIAKLMGANVDSAQRALIVNPTPVQDAGNVLAFGVYGYESIAFAIPNPKAICTCDATSAVS